MEKVKYNLLMLFFTAHALRVIPESLKIAYTNDKYVEDVHANIRRISRQGDYVANLWGTIKHTWADNVTVHIVVTEYLHNEYRRSFIEFHYKLCDFISHKSMLGQMFIQKGITCPTAKGQYAVHNLTIQSQKFPNVWPFEKGGADVSVTITETGELIADGYIHVLFKNK